MTQQYFKHFSIVIDEEKPKKNVSCFQRLISAVNKKFKTVQHRPSTIATQNILKMFRTIKNDAQLGDVIFIKTDEFDFDFIKNSRELHRSIVKENKYNLMNDFDRLVELLTSFVEERKERKPKYEYEITIEVPKRKKVRKVTTYDKITILERWVKIGYKMYRRQFDAYSGDEYIVVDGDVYEIKQDHYGKEYLA